MKSVATSDRVGLRPRYICQQVNYSLVARDVEHEIVPLALDQGVGLMAWSPLQAGSLTGKFRRDVRPAVSRLNELAAPGTIDYERLYRIVDVLTRSRPRGTSRPRRWRSTGSSASQASTPSSSARVTKPSFATTSPPPRGGLQRTKWRGSTR